MKGKKEFLQKGIAVCLSAGLLSGMLSATGGSLKVQAEGTGVRDVNLNLDGSIAGIRNPDIPEGINDPWSGSYVYFGTWEGNPVRYRVLAPKTTDFNSEATMFLDCDDILWKAERPGEDERWSESALRREMNDEGEYSGNGFLTKSFSAEEQGALAESTNDSHGGWEIENAPIVHGGVTYGFDVMNFEALTGEKAFILDAREAVHEEYGYWRGRILTEEEMKSGIYHLNRHKNGKTLGSAQEYIQDVNSGRAYWYLRSYRSLLNAEGEDLGGCYPVFVVQSGFGNSNAVPTSQWVSPALNIKHSSILFATEANTAKSPSFAVTSDKSGSESWKLTMWNGAGFDAARKTGETECVQAGGSLNIAVSALPDHSGYTQISAMLVDGSGTVAAYGKIADGVQTGVIEVTIPPETADGVYTLKVFAEMVSGENLRTDYASNMADIELKVGEYDYGTEWKSDGDSHWHECFCGKKSDTEDHEEDGGTVTTEPTVDRPGIRTYQCRVCGYVMRTEEIPKKQGEKSSDTYVITYDANGGSGTMEEGEAEEGQAFTLPKNQFIPPEEKQFLEWAVGSVDGTRAGAGETCLFKEDTTVYAVWEEAGSGEEENPPQDPDEEKNPPQDPDEEENPPQDSEGEKDPPQDSGGTENPKSPAKQNAAAADASSVSAKTGDSTPVLCLFSLMFASLSGFAAMQEYRRKHGLKR